MKNFYKILFLIFFISSRVTGQNPTPNPGFENWTNTGNHYDPDDWNTLNPSTSVIGVLSATRATGADVHSGTYAIKLTTKLVFGQIANGIATTGNIVVTPPYGVNGGIPFTGRPDSIAGWYKCSPQPGDTGFAQISLLAANAIDTIGFVRWWAPPVAVSTYTRFSKAIEYFSSATPAISQWILSSSKGFNQVVNSSIIFDDIQLITNPVGIAENKDKVKVKIFPSVTCGPVSVWNDTEKKIRIYLFNSSGQLVFQYAISKTLTNLDIRNLPGGLYLYKIVNEDHQVIHSGKIVHP